MSLLSDIFGKRTEHGNFSEIPCISSIMPNGAIQMINAGHLPVMNTSRVVLKRGEQCCFVERAIYLVEKVIKHRDGSLGGFSFRICKGVTFRTGGFRSSPREETLQQNFKGILYITTQRIIFVGEQNSFEKKCKDLTAIVPEGKKIQLHFSSKILTLFVPDGDIVAKILHIIE